MNFSEALAALEARQETRIELGLDRVRAHLARRGAPQEKFPCLHVAGTNGKGSTCAMLASALKASGRRTGLYTSPHLISPRERIQVDGEPILEADFARLLETALDADPGSSLTYFELLTSMAFSYFAEQGVEAAVLETGLGGRLDATTVVEKPKASVITSISLDHTALLGKTVAAIAAEKAGILKPGVPAVCPRLSPEAMGVIEETARRVGAPLTVVERPYETVSMSWHEQRQVLEDPQGRRFALGLLGRAQAMNAALARAALNASGLTASAADFAAGLSSVRWPGRFEVLRSGGKTVVLDGAHNPEAARRLAETWAETPWSREPAVWVLGVLADKDAEGIISALADKLGEVICVAPPSPRALPAEKLAALVRRLAPRAQVSEAADCGAALASFQKGGRPAAVVAGSFYLVARAGAELGREAVHA